jgi:PTH1 family peptidyl-tRNA hydrolase
VSEINKDSNFSFLVFGLGNPEKKYLNTRHNIGATVVRSLAQENNIKLKKYSKMQAELGLMQINKTEQILLGIPRLYMNESGKSLRSILKAFSEKIAQDKIIVVHDELDLNPGVVRIKKGGSFAGHNGLKSIKEHTTLDQFIRIRIGIGKPPHKEQGADYVLSEFSPDEKHLISNALESAKQAIILIVTTGLQTAMNKINSS